MGLFSLSVGLHAALHPWVLAVGAGAYAGFGFRAWRYLSWLFRLSYLLGGGVLALYEFHMFWWIGVIGFLLVGLPLWLEVETPDQKKKRREA